MKKYPKPKTKLSQLSIMKQNNKLQNERKLESRSTHRFNELTKTKSLGVSTSRSALHRKINNNQMQDNESQNTNSKQYFDDFDQNRPTLNTTNSNIVNKQYIFNKKH